MQVHSHTDSAGFFEPLKGVLGMPHGFCYQWRTDLVGMHVISDAVTALAYLGIALVLFRFIKKAKSDIPFEPIFVAFGLFIALCGLNHAMMVVTVWYPTYWASGWVKVAMAATSLVTAFWLPRVTPRVFETIEDARQAADNKTRMLVAEEANATKNHFLAVMSHELRTPLAAVVGYTHLIKDELFGPVSQEQDEHLGRILTSSDHLTHLIDEVLTFTKSESGKMRVYRERISVGELVHSVREVMMPLAQAKDIDLSFVLPPHPIRMYTDVVKVRQILINILSNAIKFTERGRVSLIVYEELGTVVFKVGDTGCGIPKDKLPHIFTPFWQGQQELTRRHGGIGLGLAVVKQLTDGLEGTVTVVSTENKGTSVTIVLPSGEGPND
jgi:signal transduction histidine kinase